MSTGAVFRVSSVCTAAPHCSTDNRQSRRVSVGSGVHAVPYPPVPVVDEPPLPVFDEPPVPVFDEPPLPVFASHRCRCSTNRRYPGPTGIAVDIALTTGGAEQRRCRQKTKTGRGPHTALQFQNISISFRDSLPENF